MSASFSRAGVRRRQACAVAIGIACWAQFAWFTSARGDTGLQILALDPAPPAVFGRWQAFSMRIGYSTTEPAFIGAQPSFDGRAIPAINGGEAHRPPGQGEILLWFTYVDAQKVDAVKVTAKAASGTLLAEASLPVSLVWTGQDAPMRQPADWVQRMRLEDERRGKAAIDAVMNSPRMRTMGAVVQAMMLAIPGYLALQAWLIWRLRGGWRKAAAVPLWPMGLILAYTVYAFLDGSNLFPLVLILTAPLAFAYLAILAGLRWLSRHLAA